MWQYFYGKKTFICAGMAGLSTVVFSLGLIEGSTWMVLMGFFVPGAQSTIRLAMQRLEKKIEEVPPKVEAVEQKVETVLKTME